MGITVEQTLIGEMGKVNRPKGVSIGELATKLVYYVIVWAKKRCLCPPLPLATLQLSLMQHSEEQTSAAQ